MKKEIIYYSDSRLDKTIDNACKQQLKLSGLPIVSCTLKPDYFGRNICLYGNNPGYSSMVQQILACLKASDADVVYFCEHDVLYHPSHFLFTPERDDTFYYNRNNWRWQYPDNKLVTFDELISLSQLCVYREKALKHFTQRWNSMKRHGWDKKDDKNPRYARLWGYEPGVKSKKRGGYNKEKWEIFWSDHPNIDIRTGTSFTISKTNYRDFRNKPTNWQETTLDGVSGWKVEDFTWN